MALASDRTYGLYNMTSGTKLDLEDQARAVIEVFGNPNAQSKIVYRPEKPTILPRSLFDMSKAEEDFGFVPEYKSYVEMIRTA